jgi:hypothetical protein
MGRTSYHSKRKSKVRNNSKTRQEIKIVNGKPYLEYLPNMLIKGKDKVVLLLYSIRIIKDHNQSM